jgi:hypothetical protein
VPESDRAGAVTAMERTLVAWHAYRDEVAVACGLSR